MTELRSGGVAVNAHGIVHIYRTEGHDVAALSGVTLTVGAGQMVALLGPSGSGKSTLLAACAGLVHPSAGRLDVAGVRLATMSERELDEHRSRHLGMMLQGADNNLITHLDCAANVRLARDRVSAEDVETALELVGLPGFAAHEVSRLGAEERQLLALAASIAHRPGLLLADEPTSRLNHAARDRVVEALTRINREWGTTVLLVTHDPVVAARMPRTVTIRDGRIGAEGRSGEEFAVITADGALPLPPEVLLDFPVGTLLRVRVEDDGLRMERAEADDAGS